MGEWGAYLGGTLVFIAIICFLVPAINKLEKAVREFHVSFLEQRIDVLKNRMADLEEEEEEKV